jgi:hypothetical protein
MSVLGRSQSRSFEKIRQVLLLLQIVSRFISPEKRAVGISIVRIESRALIPPEECLVSIVEFPSCFAESVMFSSHFPYAS